jgi:hypothetical protein
MANIFSIESNTGLFLIVSMIVNEMTSDMRRYNEPGITAGLYRCFFSRSCASHELCPLQPELAYQLVELTVTQASQGRTM